MIIRKNDQNNQKTEQNSQKPKKQAGLGRGLESLLEDNAPNLSSKTQVVKKDGYEDARARRESGNSLYRKDGAMSYVKTPKRSGS